eukprot:117132-Chlamydomonas_euryale.AAC.15
MVARRREDRKQSNVCIRCQAGRPGLGRGSSCPSGAEALVLDPCRGAQVLHIDRNNYYGGASASLQLTQVRPRRA